MAEEPHERAAGREGRRHAVKEPVLEHRLLLQVAQPQEVGPLQVLNQRMVCRKVAGGAFQALAFELEVLAEAAVVPGPTPRTGMVDDRLPDLAEGPGIGTPHPDGQKALLRLDVEVEAGGVDVRADLVAKVDANVGLVGFAVP